MKKILGILFLSLLFNGVAYADHLKVKLKDENKIIIRHKFNNLHEKPMAEAHCAQHKKFYQAITIGDKNDGYGKKWNIWACVLEPVKYYNDKKVKFNITNYDPNHPWVKSNVNKKIVSTSTSSTISTNDKIAQSKKICKELGFKTNSEKFADCALKMMSLQFETGSKVSNNDGSSTQKIIVQQQDNFDIGDFFFGLQKIVDDNYRSTKNSSSTSSTGQNCRIYERQWGAEVKCK